MSTTSCNTNTSPQGSFPLGPPRACSLTPTLQNAPAQCVQACGNHILYNELTNKSTDSLAQMRPCLEWCSTSLSSDNDARKKFGQCFVQNYANPTCEDVPKKCSMSGPLPPSPWNPHKNQ